MSNKPNPTESEAVVQSNEDVEVDVKASDEELHRRIAELEENIASRDQALAALKESLASAVAKYRASVLAALPRMPQELVNGETIEEIDASLALAQGIMANVKQQLETEETAKSVPAGAPGRTHPDYSSLSPTSKIIEGLRQKGA